MEKRQQQPAAHLKPHTFSQGRTTLDNPLPTVKAAAVPRPDPLALLGHAPPPSIPAPASTGAVNTHEPSSISSVVGSGVVGQGGEDDTGGACVVCWNADRETILAPCGHHAMCR